MRLQDILETQQPIPFLQVAMDPQLVRQIQIRLKALQLPIGNVDGLYGTVTASAITEFCRAFNLPVEQLTPEIAKKLIEAKSIPGFDPTLHLATPEVVASALNCSLNDCVTYLPALLTALNDKQMLDKLTLIAALGTIRVETGGFKPIHEFGDEDYFNRMYDNRSDLGNIHAGDGARYHGRGFIQLTGRTNYRNYGEKIGADLENQPDLALDPDASAKILALYFWDHYIDSSAHAQDWREVRRKVNGGYNGLDVFLHYVERAKSALL